MRLPLLSGSCFLLALAVTPAPAAGGLPFAGEAAEKFLATAEVVDREALPAGITRPFKLTLTGGGSTAHAAWKTVDRFNLRHRFSDGRMEPVFRDTWKHEVAAYELDKLLGLGMVPPTVERQIGDERGALQLWVEDAITEAKRMEEKRRPPDVQRWSRQMYTVRLIHQLTGDTDSRNVSNLLVDSDFHLWVIDFSRAFRTHRELRRESALRRFSTSLLERLETLTPEILQDRLGRWLTNVQIEALLARRDRVRDLARRRVAELGEEAVLFP